MILRPQSVVHYLSIYMATHVQFLHHLILGGTEGLCLCDHGCSVLLPPLELCNVPQDPGIQGQGRPWVLTSLAKLRLQQGKHLRL